MPLGRALASATLATLAAGALPAAEIIGGFVDMRLGGGIMGGDYDLDVSDNVGVVRGDNYEDSFDSNYRIKLDWVGSLGLRSYGGWIWGIGGSYNMRTDTELTYADDDFPVTTDDVDFHAWAAHGHIGYAVPFGEHFQLEILPWAGIGRAYLETPESNGHLNTASDAYTEVGLNVNGVFTLRNGFQFGASLGYMYWETTIEHENIEAGSNNDSVAFKFIAWDYVAMLFIGVRL